MIKTYQEVQAEDQDVESVQLVSCLLSASLRFRLVFQRRGNGLLFSVEEVCLDVRSVLHHGIVI